MAINGIEPLRRVSSLLKELIRQKSNSVLLAKKNCNWSMLLAVRLYLPVQYYHFKTFYLLLPTTTSYCLLKAFKICRCYKATAENLRPKLTDYVDLPTVQIANGPAQS